jgi:hypothetical protein
MQMRKMSCGRAVGESRWREPLERAVGESRYEGDVVLSVSLALTMMRAMYYSP